MLVSKNFKFKNITIRDVIDKAGIDKYFFDSDYFVSDCVIYRLDDLVDDNFIATFTEVDLDQLIPDLFGTVTFVEVNELLENNEQLRMKTIEELAELFIDCFDDWNLSIVVPPMEYSWHAFNCYRLSRENGSWKETWIPIVDTLISMREFIKQKKSCDYISENSISKVETELFDRIKDLEFKEENERCY